MKKINILHIKNIYVKPKDRKYGIITSYLEKLIKLCDNYNIIIELNPNPYDREDNDWQYAYDRLINFYKRFGFVENEDKKISNSKLIRMPIS